MKIFLYANKMIKTVGIDIHQQWAIVFNLYNGQHDFLIITNLQMYGVRSFITILHYPFSRSCIKSKLSDGCAMHAQNK
jgi:hypothetical protein